MKGWIASMCSRAAPSISIRVVNKFDLSMLVHIDRQHHKDAWTMSDFQQFMSTLNCGAVVGDLNGETVGFSMFQWRHAVLQLDVVVHTDHLRKGIGTQFIKYFVDRLHVRHRPQMICLVGEENLAGQLFCKSLGFEATGIIDQHHSTHGEARYLFRYRVQS